ncbi:hypothetical protein K438DRAFT_1992862 [Mycena galopus ATCC 62051]|nr:hypothetical protein K438DRAFT_1992862 [Mycena galopus ATCC 62051]
MWLYIAGPHFASTFPDGELLDHGDVYEMKDQRYYLALSRLCVHEGGPRPHAGRREDGTYFLPFALVQRFLFLFSFILFVQTFAVV